MPAKSKAQQRLFGMVHAYQKHGGDASPKVKKIAGQISYDDADEFASTKHKGLPEKKKSFKEWAKDRKEFKTITITCRDHENSLENLLQHIRSIGNTGHSFSIVVDPEGDDTEKHYWDGDGSDYIKNIEIS